MKHSIERLDILISVRLNPAGIADIDACNTIPDHCIEDAAKETSIIRICLFQKSVNTGKEKALQLLVQQCQASVIRLLDKVFGYKCQNPSFPHIAIYDAIISILMHLLDYIAGRFPKYFNKDEKVPDHILPEIQAFINDELSYLEANIFSKTDPKLNYIINNYLQKFTLADKEHFISYHMTGYIKELLTEIKKIVPTCHDPNQQLLDILIYMNFNTGDLLDYCVHKVKFESSACTSFPLKVDSLLSSLKKLNQIKERPGIAFKPQMLSLKEQVGVWLSEEISYLEKQQALIRIAGMGPEPALNMVEDEKLITTLSVQQLAVFIRAAKDTGIITNKNQKTFLKTFAKFFRTPQAETISAESLRIKYYTPEPKAVQSVKDLLHAMLHKIRSY